MKKCLLLISLIASNAVAGWAADDSIIYIRAVEEDASEEHVAIDQQVRAILSSDFTIVDIHDDTSYVKPKPIAGGLPHTAISKSGEQVGGHVWVGYVVTNEGYVTEPHVLKTTDPRLNSTALRAMDEWRFKPAKLNGVTIQTAAASPFSFEIEETPTEFVTQILEPIGGKIQRPKDWFCSEGHGSRSYTWTISRENTAGKTPYRTGVRIQTFVGIKAATAKTAKQFILDFVASKKEAATKVHGLCKEKDVGLFTRICLETEEGRDHILYSLFWGSSDMDIAVVSIAGDNQRTVGNVFADLQQDGRI